MLIKLTLMRSSTTQTQSFVAFPLQQWLSERTRILRYVCTVSLFLTATGTETINALSDQM